ncbi:MAG: rhodanese-like domain-containing protein [Coriobacteriia bacterium]|nr:rhodanese-like domain-containing protein [Coriobacteriia bacterium]MBN2841029.1 rhodanese-like domain-containing protein [Coriobacteriia bacterium]
MKRPHLIGLAIGVVVLVVAVIALSAGAPAPGLIGNGDLTRLGSEGARIVDVRTAAEFAGAHIEGAENIPLRDLPQAAEGWDRAEPIVLYCAVGDRSSSAAELLQSMGFERVYDLSGGIAQWEGALAGGAQTAAAEPPQVATSGTPVMYEFYTDW